MDLARVIGVLESGLLQSSANPTSSLEGTAWLATPLCRDAGEGLAIGQSLFQCPACLQVGHGLGGGPWVWTLMNPVTFMFALEEGPLQRGLLAPLWNSDWSHRPQGSYTSTHLEMQKCLAYL